MKLKKATIVSCLFFIFGVVSMLIPKAMSRDRMIVDYGIRTTNVIVTACSVIGLIVFSLGVFILVVSLFKNKATSYKEKKAVEEAENMMEATSLSEAEVLQALVRFKGLSSRTDNQIISVEQQIAEATRKVAQMEKVIGRNDASEVNEVLVTIQEARRTIKKNVGRSMINRLMLLDKTQLNSKTTSKHLDEIDKIVSRNYQILTLIDELMNEAVCYIDEKQNGGPAEGAQLKVMTAAIQQLRGIDALKL